MCDLAVLVVEPVEEDLREVCGSLETNGVNRLLCVEGGVEALTYLRKDSDIDIVILSEHLKDIGGTQLLPLIRKINKGIFCILVDDTKDLVAGLRARSNGASDFIRKWRFKEDLNDVIPMAIKTAEAYNRLWE